MESEERTTSPELPSQLDQVPHPNIVESVYLLIPPILASPYFTQPFLRQKSGPNNLLSNCLTQLLGKGDLFRFQANDARSLRVLEPNLRQKSRTTRF
jgi:hypothetical protein